MTIDRLRERVEAHIIHGAPNACWKWDASTLPSGRPRIGVRESGRNFSVTAARIIVAARDGFSTHSESGALAVSLPPQAVSGAGGARGATQGFMSEA